MYRVIILCLSILAVLLAPADDAPCMTNCAEITFHTSDYTPFHAPFDITAQVMSLSTSETIALVLEDGSGGYSVPPPLPEDGASVRPGDLVRIKGRIDINSRYIKTTVSSIDVVSSNPPPAPHRATAAEILNGKWDQRLVCVSGTLKDILDDDIDPQFTYLTLDADGKTLYLACRSGRKSICPHNQLIGATVAIQGVVTVMRPTFSARHLGRVISFPDLNHLKVMRESSHDIFTVPDIGSLSSTQPADVAAAGLRRATGRVLATWQGNSFLMRLPDGSCSRVSLTHGSLPYLGQTVAAVGFPTTDLYYINLTRATWQPAEAEIPPERAPTNLTAAAIATDANGHTCFKPKLHGVTVRISGTVCRTSNAETASGVLALEDGDISFQIDTSSCPTTGDDIEIGCRIEATGICILDIENWTPNTAFPRIKGFSVIVRTPDDIRLIERSPWWTKERLLVALFATLGILFCALALILLLRHLLARREREIKREICARVESDCLVQERTRLAVELHDSITQNLTGATLAMRVAQKESASLNERAGASLDLAIKTVDSSLADLRNCIWDLRNSTLEEADFAEAIRLTIQPHVDDIDLALRFNVPRERLSDNAAHAILSIIRELVINATRHGKATSVRIAGAIESGKLLFSVADNGCGFDVDGRPGVRQGHFGLRGVSERVKAFQGDIDIHSAIGKGTKITISIALPNGGRS